MVECVHPETSGRDALGKQETTEKNKNKSACNTAMRLHIFLTWDHRSLDEVEEETRRVSFIILNNGKVYLTRN